MTTCYILIKHAQLAQNKVTAKTVRASSKVSLAIKFQIIMLLATVFVALLAAKMSSK